MEVTSNNQTPVSTSSVSNLSSQAYHLMSPQVSNSGMPMQCSLTSVPIVQQVSAHNQSLLEPLRNRSTNTSSLTTIYPSQHQPIYNQIYQSLQTYQQPMTAQQQHMYSPPYIAAESCNPVLPTLTQTAGSVHNQTRANSNISSTFNNQIADQAISVNRPQHLSHLYGRPSSLTLNLSGQNRAQAGGHLSIAVQQQQQPRMNGSAQKSINSMFAAINSPSQLERMIEKSSSFNSKLPFHFTQPPPDVLRQETMPPNDDSISSNAHVVDQSNRLEHWLPQHHQHLHQPQQQQHYYQQHRLLPQQLQVQLNPYRERGCNEISLCSYNDMSTSTSKTIADSHRCKLVESSSSSSAVSSSSAPTAASTLHGSVTAKEASFSDKLTCPQASKGSDRKFKSYLAHLVLASNVPFAYAIILVAFLITVIAATSIITILTIILTITGYTAYPLTENTFNTSLVIGVVCASFALALVTASLVVWRRHCQAAYYYLDDPQSASRGTNSPQLSETYDDSEYGSIPVQDWAKHVQKLHADGDIGFSREFGQIQAFKSANLTCENSRIAENKHKNRYINIVAYDHTRVMLRQLPGQKKPGSDYINANFIDGYNKPRAYIGTQGPLVSTFDDYWRMIWEQRVVIIVMITNLQERGRRKCDMYWPKEGSETYGHIQVKLLQEVVMATYTLRTFTAKNLKMKKKVGSERTVYQYHYTNWPDHGVPDHPLPVLSFVRKSASANPTGAGAIICHCSAGCGRSGTYIVIDAMLKQIRHRQSINVVDFLKHIRNQRNYLVQTEEQYVFIHDALVEAIESGETEIASNFIAKYIQLLQTGGQSNAVKSHYSSYSLCNSNSAKSQLGTVQAGGGLSVVAAAPVSLDRNNNNPELELGQARSQSAGSQWSLLERQYRLVASFKAKDFNVVSALKPANKNKNRTLNLIPLEAHRVHITPKPGLEGSDYINATFLMGFNHLREFIVTQHPVYETYSDFWQMVYDHNSQTIVLLSACSIDDHEFGQFWPQKEDEVDYGSFKVKLIGEQTRNIKANEGALIVTRDFIMRSNQDDYELQTKLIHCPGWPEHCGPLASVFDLIQVVQSTTQQQASRQRMHDGHANTTTVTIGQEHEPQNGGPIIVVDKFGGTEAATFAVLTTLYKQINFEDAVDVYMYAKLAHLRRPGIWSSQDDYLFLYRAIENYASSLIEAAAVSATSQGGSLAGPNSPGAPFSQTMTLDRHRHKQRSASSALRGTSTMRRPSKALAEAGQNNRSANGELGSNSSNDLLLTDHQAGQHNQRLLAAIKQPARVKQQQAALRPLSGQPSAQGASPYSSALSVGASPHQQLLVSPSQQVQPGAGRAQLAQHLYPMG